MDAPEAIKFDDSRGTCVRLVDVMDYLEATQGNAGVMRWHTWFHGQTGAMGDDGELLVYASDWERYQAGLRALD